jgi:hypothetical protein
VSTTPAASLPDQTVHLLERILQRLMAIENLLRGQQLKRLEEARAASPQVPLRALRAAPPPAGETARKRYHTEAQKRAERAQVRRWLGALDMNASQLAKAAGFNVSTLYLVLKGYKGLSFQAEMKIRALLKERGIAA